MAAVVQPKLNDGSSSTNLKHEAYIEEIPGVNKYFLGRCYNAVDSQVRRTSGNVAQIRCRRTMVTYQMAIRKLARRVCLDPRERQSRAQIDEITRTRAFLGQDFFDIMGFYGVDIIPLATGWTFSESMQAEDMAAALDILID